MPANDSSCKYKDYYNTNEYNHLLALIGCYFPAIMCLSNKQQSN